MVSVGYICTLAWSRLFFQEVITRAKVMQALGLMQPTSLLPQPVPASKQAMTANDP